MSDNYKEDDNLPNYWFYGDYRIQGPVEVHKFVIDFTLNNINSSQPILDLAAGEGALAKQLMDKGYNVSTTSWNDKIKISTTNYNLNLDYEFTLKDVGNQKYDLITAIEIIEHLENPSLFLRCCNQILSDQGFLIISTPNVESGVSRLQWFFRGCPNTFNSEEITNNRHISLMWRHGLEYLFKQANLIINKKLLLGKYYFKNRISSYIKRMIIILMHLCLEGDIYGSTRVYVLTKSSNTNNISDQFNFY